MCRVWPNIPHLFDGAVLVHIVLLRLCETVLLDKFAHTHVSWDRFVVMRTGTHTYHAVNRLY